MISRLKRPGGGGLGSVLGKIGKKQKMGTLVGDHYMHKIHKGVVCVGGGGGTCCVRSLRKN